MDLRCLGLLLLLGIARAGSSGPAEPRPGLPSAQILTPRSGFTGAYPRSLLTDREGRLWVATDLGGLFVGDGLRFLSVPLPEPLRGVGISDMAQDPGRRIWLLTREGLGTLMQGTWRVDGTIRDRPESPRRRTAGIFVHPKGTTVLVASGQGYRIRGQGWPEPMTLPGSATDGEPSLVWQGDLLVANRGGRFWREDEQGWADLPSVPLAPLERPQGPVRSDVQGHLYLLTDQRLFHLAPGAGAWQTLPFTPSGDALRMSRLEDGHIWILENGHAHRGLGGVLDRLPMPHDLSLYGAEAKHLDAEGNLWIARTDLVRIPVLGLVLSHTGPGFPPAREVWNILRDRDGALWVAAEGGLFRRDTHGWRTVKEVATAHGLDVGPDGALYLRSRRRLMRVDPHTLRPTPQAIPLQPGGLQIRRGPVIQGRRMWVTDTEGRLAVADWDGRSWTWQWERSLPEIGTNPYLFRDEQGRPWYALDHQVYCQVAGQWEEVPMPYQRRMVDLTFPSPDSGLAVQFSPPALLSLKRSSVGWTVKPLLGPDELRGIGAMYAVRQDAHGAIWLNTDRGAVRMEPSQPGRLQLFSTELGLPGEDTNQGALFLEADRVWVGTALGLGEIRLGTGGGLPPLTPPSLLEARCGPWTRTGPDPAMTIRHGQGSLVWELGFPGAARGEGAHFEFREVGGAWTALAGKALQFPEISPGHHAYEVRVAPFLGESGPSRRLEIHVLPPWYRHPLALALWVLLLAGAVHLAFRWRLQVLKRRNLDLSLAVATATEGLRAREQDLELVNRRLYELNDAKNRIIGLAAHDLRNPLSGILLTCELLAEDVQAPEALKSVGAIRGMGHTMMDLIQRLLDVHAIEAGHAEAPKLQTLDLLAALQQARERALSPAGRKRINVSCQEGGHTVAPARGDLAQVGQVLDNFLSNAVKFSSPGAGIWLELQDRGDLWRVSVRDEGPGLTAEDLERVFTEYGRLSARPTAGESSVGLGLSLVKRMTEAMGGAVGVQSAPGRGATFWLELPKA